MTLIPMWSCRLPPVVLTLSKTHALAHAHTHAPSDMVVATGEFKVKGITQFLFFLKRQES